MAPFAGYSMPIQYQGVIAESKAVRQAAGMFDVSHMARLRIRGPQALDLLEWITSNDVAKLSHRRGQYSLLLNERGGCVDDLVLYRIDADEFVLVANAANHAKDLAWIESHNRFEARVDDETDRSGMIAVQGPRAVHIVADLAADPDAVRQAPLFGVVTTSVAGVPALVARSGYTGEDGFEIVAPAERTETLWNALLAGGVVPCGLGARDVLRVEAGLPLYGHELSEDLSPIAAGLAWAVSKTKTFVGSEPIARARAEGAPRKLRGVRLEGKRLPVPGTSILVDGREVGEVTSGVFSPALDRGIALAFVDAAVPLGIECLLDMRGRPEAGRIVAKRFLE